MLPSGSDDQDLDMIFAHYDRSGEGRIDYKELSKMLEARHSDAADRVLKQAAEFRRGAQPPQQEHHKSEAEQELVHMMALFKDRIKMRGARGILNLQRMFKIMDDDQSNVLNIAEFSKACRDFKIGISDEYLPTVFNAFDLNHDGTLSIDEFLRSIRGEMSQVRLNAVAQAFRAADTQGEGQIDPHNLRDLYHADRHPDVIQGKR